MNRSEKKLNSYLGSRINRVSGLLLRAGSFTPEDFHELRVEIKKIKAFFKLVSYFNRTFPKGRLFKPLRSLFKAAGKVRELHVEEGIIEKYAGHKLENYLLDLKRSELKAKKDFYRDVNRMPEKNIQRIPQQAQPYFSTVSEAHIAAYLKKENRKIKRSARDQKLRPGQIHEVRRKIKENYYNQTIAHTPVAVKPPAKKIHKLLGKWHDLSVIKKRLQKEIKHSKKKNKERPEMKKLGKKLVSEQKVLRRKINVRIGRAL